MQGQETCTQQMCKWTLPSFQTSVQYLPVAEIDFTSACNKKHKLDNTINSLNATSEHIMQGTIRDTDTRKNYPTNEKWNSFISV